MKISNIFILGVEKCGTTALADWMLNNELVQDRVAGIKEPFLYVNDDPHPVIVRSSTLPILDATVAYAMDPEAIARMPERDTQLILCLRNQFERLWSAYKMRKLIGVNNQATDKYFMDVLRSKPLDLKDSLSASVLLTFHDVHKKYFPRRSHNFVEHYLNKELEHIRTHSFMERIEYELAFYLSRRQLPMASILGPSFYYSAIRNVLNKYQPSDLSVVSVKQLSSTEARRAFVKSVFEKDTDTSQIPFMFSSAEIEIDEKKPDFNGKEFDLLRSCFRYDLAQVRELIPNTRFGDRFLDNADLDRYMVAR